MANVHPFVYTVYEMLPAGARFAINLEPVPITPTRLGTAHLQQGSTHTTHTRLGLACQQLDFSLLQLLKCCMLWSGSGV